MPDRPAMHPDPSRSQLLFFDLTTEDMLAGQGRRSILRIGGQE